MFMDKLLIYEEVLLLKRDIMKALAMLTQVGISMLVPIFLCLWIGKSLDKAFDTGILFLIVFIILGVGSAFRTLYMMTAHKYKNVAEEEQKRRDIYKGRYLRNDDGSEDNEN